MSTSDLTEETVEPEASAWADCADADAAPCPRSRRQGDAAGREARTRRAGLTRTIEGEIVPRLMLARRARRATAGFGHASRADMDAADVTELVRLLVVHDSTIAAAYVEALLERGVPAERICLDLLAPAARELGARWERDECDFMQVTVGLGRLQQILRTCGGDVREEDGDRGAQRRILLCPCTGEQHTFGLSVVAQFLRRAGWEVWQEFPRRRQEVLELLRQHWFAAAGLSIGCDSRLDAMRTLIADMRRASRNPELRVLVGGPLLVNRADLAVRVGADDAAADGAQAVRCAERLCGEVVAQ